MTRSAFFQPRRSKDAQDQPTVRGVEGGSVKIAPTTRAAPRRRTCDEGCPGRVWSRRAGGGRSQVQRTEARTEAGASGYGSYGSYRFGVPEPEPTLELLEEQLGEVIEEEELLRAKLKDLEHQLAHACGADGEDYSHRKSRFKSRVEDAAVSLRQLSQQRAQILEGTDPEVQEEQRKREEIRRFKTSAGYSTEEAIDLRIEELEQQMYDVAMELLQEKRVLAEIQSLQRQKEEVREHRRREETLRSDEEIIRWRLEDIGSQLKAKLREQQEANSDLAALEEERQNTLAQSPLVAERSKAHHRLNECLQLKTQLESKVQGLHARERAKEEQRRMEEEMRRRAAEEEELRRQAEEEEEERRQKLRDERRRLREERLQKERKQDEAVQVAVVPHISGIPELPKEPPGSAEMRLLEQTLLYCKKLLPKNHDEAQEKKPVEYNNPEGSLIIIPKEERSEEYLFAPPRPRRHEGKIRKRPPTSKLKKSKEAQQVLLHTPLSLKLFEELRIIPPVNTSDVPATIDEVEERLAEHKQSAERWELKRQELLEQKLQNELGKVREAQESREQERRRRLNMALMWLQDFENQASQSEGPQDQRGLEDLLNAARSMGATEQQLRSAQELLRRWRREEAEAGLAEAIDAIQALEVEELSEEPDHITATQDLEQAILKAKKVDVDPQLLESAEELLKAAQASQEGQTSAEGGEPAVDSVSQEEETAEVNDGNSPTGQDAEEFVPTILNLDDDEEELVFDLGM